MHRSVQPALRAVSLSCNGFTFFDLIFNLLILMLCRIGAIACPQIAVACINDQAPAYHVFLSELMLQQTVVATVIPYFQKFIYIWPDIHALAAADENMS